MTPDDTLNHNQSQEPADTDPLQPPDDLFNPLRDQEQLPEDGDPPAAAPDDVPAFMPADHPDTDTDVDSQEVYDAGLDSVADAPRNSGNRDGTQQTRDMAPLEPIEGDEDELAA